MLVIVGGILLRQQVEELGKVTPSEEALFWTLGTRGTASYISHWENNSTYLLLSFHVSENVLENVDGVEMYRLWLKTGNGDWRWMFRKEDLAPRPFWRGHWIKPGLNVGESWSFADPLPLGIQGEMRATGKEILPVGDDEYEVFVVESSAFSPPSMEGDGKYRLFYSEDIHMILRRQELYREKGEDKFKLMKDWRITSLELASTE